MDSMDQYLCGQLSDTLAKIADQSIETVGLASTCEIFETILTQLQRRDEQKTCVFTRESGQGILSCLYPSSDCLAGDLDALLQIRGLMIVASPPPPLMEEIHLRVHRRGLDQSVDLRARAVHHSPDGAAIEVFPATTEQRHRLKVLTRAEPPADIPADAPPLHTAPPHTAPAKPTAAPSPIADDGGPPPVDRLVDLPEQPTHQWDPSGDDRAAMLLDISKADGYSVLAIQSQDTAYHYLVHHGMLIDVRTDPFQDPEDRFITKLIATGLVSDDDLERAEALSRIHQISRQDALVDIGCITVEQLLDAIRQCLLDELQALWTLDFERAEHYLLHHRPPLRLRRSSLSLVQEVARHIDRRLATLSTSQLEARAQALMGVQLSCPTPLPIAIDDLPFNAQEQRFVEVVLASPRTLADLERVSHLSGPRLLRRLLLLEELHLLEHHQHQRRLPEHDTIHGLVQQVRSPSHFDVLGIHWSAYTDEVHNAYQALLDQLDVSAEAQRGLSDELQEIRHQADQAFALLSSPPSRKSYRNSLIDDFAQRSALEVYEKKADSLRMRRDISKLIDCLERIVELSPSNRQAHQQLRALKQADAGH